MVSRICLDRLRSAAARREKYVGQWLPEPVVTTPLPSSSPDPLAAVVRKQDARFAALVVLDTLTPPQRVAFVLHEGFAVPYDEIADILDISTEAARQLAARARKAFARTPDPVPDEEHAALVGQLLEALNKGDVDAVVALLHPDVHTIGDAGGTTSTTINVVEGREKNARLWLGLRRKLGFDAPERASGFEFVLVNGQLGVLVHEFASENGYPGTPQRVYGFTVHESRIWGIYDLVNPAKLRGIRLPR